MEVAIYDLSDCEHIHIQYALVNASDLDQRDEAMNSENGY
jgi:hypothetical protein